MFNTLCSIINVGQHDTCMYVLEEIKMKKKKKKKKKKKGGEGEGEGETSFLKLDRIT